MLILKGTLIGYRMLLFTKGLVQCVSTSFTKISTFWDWPYGGPRAGPGGVWDIYPAIMF